MGRKIPGRKHHGVRDPEKQHQERLNKLKDKINAPPTNPDDQQIPKSLQRLQELRDKVKEGHFRRKKKQKPQKPMFQQGKNETKRQFLHRVHRVCEEVKMEAAFTDKYGVEVNRNDQGEIVEIKKRAKDPVQQMLKEIKKEKKMKKSKTKQKAAADAEPKLTKSQKRQMKLTLKKNNKKEMSELDEIKIDRVKFGEQAHVPPVLTYPKHGKKNETVPRPGSQDLLLKQMMGNSMDNKLKNTANKSIDRTGKRKNLPCGLRRQLDQHRDEMVQVYKQMKAKKSAYINS